MKKTNTFVLAVGFALFSSVSTSEEYTAKDVMTLTNMGPISGIYDYCKENSSIEVDDIERSKREIELKISKASDQVFSKEELSAQVPAEQYLQMKNMFQSMVDKLLEKARQVDPDDFCTVALNSSKNKTVEHLVEVMKKSKAEYELRVKSKNDSNRVAGGL
jgi:hypothetical protein